MVVFGEGAVVEAVEPVEHGRREQHGGVVRPLAPQGGDRGLGALLVALVQVDVHALQARLDVRGVELQGAPQRALGELVVLVAAEALRVEHVAAGQGGVGAGEVGVEAERLVEHAERALEVLEVQRAQHVAQQQVAAAQVELVGGSAARRPLADAGLLLRGEGEAEARSPRARPACPGR